MYIIGTAGHVDHGKSTLVEALTGIDPDRWQEEKEREMTIDLGFAWLPLPGLDEEIGVIDVPGHRDFIENMLAGVGGIDMTIFIVAADEGVMPQTKEHLAILNLLQIQGGVIALTKVDLIDDDDWLELVTLDLSDAVANTILADAPIIPVSAKTGHNLPLLRQTIADTLQSRPPRPDLGRPYLPIDRVFTISGFGTIVTGTLSHGRLAVGDTISLQPGDQQARIRGLQTHQTSRDVALPGNRVAVNLTGISKHDISRGHILAAPNTIRDTILLDVHYHHLPANDKPLKHNTNIKLFVGAAEVMARTRILGQEQIDAGQDGWLQLALETPIATMRGDRFILRRPSPPATLGGGRVLDPHPGRRHRRFRPAVIERLKILSQGTPAELLHQTLTRLQPIKQAKLFKELPLDQNSATAAWDELINNQDVALWGQYAVTTSYALSLQDKALTFINQHHQKHPLRLGLGREELRSRLQLPPPVFNQLLNQLLTTEKVIINGPIIHLPQHTITFTPPQQTKIDALLQKSASAGINGLSPKECQAELGPELGPELYLALVDLQQLYPLNNDVVYRPQEYTQFKNKIITYLQENDEINAAQARDLLQTSRKYAISLLEHLDEQKITRRIGDNRQLIK